jgi:isopentenyl diphosphate isomerase/L-lactate dehydrogenase-like FMN-dependent dehydrogenase
MNERRSVTLDEWEAAARDVLPAGVYDYVAGGAGAERTLAANESAFGRWSIWPRVLRRSGAPDPSTRVFGRSIAFPIGISPWAFQRQVRADGEIATARAARALQIPMCVSSTVLDRQGEIAATEADVWWQLYVWNDREATAAQLRSAAASGYRAIVWTIDVPTLGSRYRDVRNEFQLPVGPVGTPREFDPNLSWDDLSWIREHVGDLPLVVKGVLRPEDAAAAVDHGADAVFVSNHGGRQLDRAPASLEALPGVVDAVRGRVPVFVDGGFRHGADVLIGLALGASVVFVARPTAWGLAVDGQAGVEAVLTHLRDGFVNAMANAGCVGVDDIDAGLLRPA